MFHRKVSVENGDTLDWNKMGLHMYLELRVAAVGTTASYWEVTGSSLDIVADFTDYGLLLFSSVVPSKYQAHRDMHCPCIREVPGWYLGQVTEYRSLHTS
jgi:hypothetical protein